MKKAFNVFFLSIFVFFITSLSAVYAEDLPHLYGSAHIQDVGWADYNEGNNHLVLGTTGQGRRMEAFMINTSDPNLVVNFQSYIAAIGWQDPVGNGQASGSTGRGLAIEAYNISLAGPSAEKYDIYYRAHVQEYGWLDWAKNWTHAGTTNHGYRCEALELLLLNKGDNPPGSTTTPAVEAVTWDESQHMQRVNALRKANGLNLVTGDPNLHAVAEYRVKELPVRYSHTRPNGQSFDTAVKDVFPNYHLKAGGITENLCFGVPEIAQPVKSFDVINIYPHQRNLYLAPEVKYMAWAGCQSGSMGYSIQLFSGLDRIDFAG